MKKGIYLITCFFLLFFLSSFAGAEMQEESEAAAAQVQVINVSTDPAVLMPYDTATVTIVLKNTGTKSVAISGAELLSKELKVLSDVYGKAGAIGAGNTMSFTYTMQAGGLTGIFYPVFSVDFRDANYLRHPFAVTVQENPLEISVMNKPETWVEGKKEDISIHVGNPRDNPVTGVTIEPSKGEHEISPTSYFAGVLQSDSAVDVPFTVTPYGDEPIIFTVRYQNGINQHEVTYTLPVEAGSKSRKQAETVLSNVQIESKGDKYEVTGDVTNSGLETANAVVVESEEPAVPVFPYKVYAVGALKPDDFSSFEVTFRADTNVTSVPLKTSFKDDDGNEFSSTTQVELKSDKKSKSPEEDAGISPLIIGVIVIIAAGVLAAIWYSRKQKA